MNLLSMVVKHNTFGEGKVKEQSGGYITIAFAEDNKKFVYPDAFKTFLSIKDKAVSSAVQVEIAALEVKRAEEQEAVRLQKEAISITHNFEMRNITVPDFDNVAVNPNGRQYFFVFQNKTFTGEQRGGFLWAPKANLKGRVDPHWRLMNEIHEGDVIFHSENKNIVAISMATADCYSGLQPEELKRVRIGTDDGWRVDSKYCLIRRPIMTTDYSEDLIALQPTKYAPFNRNGRGNTGYLFSSNHAMAKFLFEKLLLKNQYLSEIADSLGLE